MPGDSSYQNRKGHLDGFSADGELLLGWAYCNRSKTILWLQSGNNLPPISVECNRPRPDLTDLGAPQDCGFELAIEHLPEPWKIPYLPLRLCWDREGAQTLPGLATQFQLPAILHNPSSFQAIEQDNITDIIPSRAKAACISLMKSGHFYRNWYLKQRRQSRPGQPPVNWEAELLALCTGHIIKAPLNPFTKDSQSRWLQELWQNPTALAPHIETTDQNLDKAIWTGTKCQNPEELRPEWRQHMLNKTLESNEKISVIIPNWNRSHTVLRAIDSAIQQTVEPFEVLVVDDGSTDNSLTAIEQRFPAALSKGKLKLFPEKHIGVSATRNRAMKEAKGTWFAYLDSDNSWHCDHLLILLYSALAHPAKPNLLYSGRTLYGARVSGLHLPVITHERKKLETGNYIDLNCVLHHRALFDRLGGFNTSLKRLVDWDLVLRYTHPSINTVTQPVSVSTINYWRHPKLLKNISTTEDWAVARDQVRSLHNIHD